MINIVKKSECTGCTACKAICSQNAIEMVEDEEGFLYPEVNKEKCVNCGLCDKVCPLINAKENKKEPKAYIFQHNDDKVRRESTSGGAFTAISEYVLAEHGIVYGAMFDENFNVVHDSVEKIEDLYKFRNSKYVQSQVRDCFRKIKTELEEDKLVCFSGTSCQIEGLKKYLRKEYNNLILVDVVCRAVPSPLIWRKYLKLRKEEYKDIKYIMFRDKYYGYKYSNLSIYNKDEDKSKEYHSGVESDPYLRAFFSNICDRPSCYECKFKKQNRESDITIWDCFEVEKYNKEFDDDKGTTRILANTEKGINIIEKLALSNKVEEITVEEATKGFLAMFQSVKRNSKREEFFEDANKLSEKELFDKYFPYNLKVKVEKYGRLFLLKTGVYKKILKLGKKIRKRD